MERLDAMVATEKNGKTYWTKVGAAFPTRTGGYKVMLDALPLNGELHLMVPLPARGETPRRSAEPVADPYSGTGDDDKPPF